MTALELPTLANIRSQGCRNLLIHCGNNRTCWHWARINADFLPDDTVLESLERRMVCTQCGLIGAEVRPDWWSGTLHVEYPQ